MIATLVWRNLRQQRGLLLALVVGCAGLELLLVWVAAHIEAGPGILNLMQQALPPAFRELIQSQLGPMSFDGMVAFGFQHPVALTGAIAFVVVVGTLPAAERESGFLDLLLARPLDRRRYVLAVVLTLATGALLLPLGLWLGVGAGRLLVEVDTRAPYWRYGVSALELAALLLALGGGTLAIAAGTRRRGPAVAWAVGATLTLFTLNFLALLWAPMRPVRWVSPFAWFDPVGAALPGTPSFTGPLVLIAVFAATTIIALLRFDRQDL